MNKQVCCNCKEEKVFAEFARTRKKKNGIQPMCCACHKIRYSKKWKKIREEQKEYYDSVWSKSENNVMRKSIYHQMRHQYLKMTQPEVLKKRNKEKYAYQKAHPEKYSAKEGGARNQKVLREVYTKVFLNKFKDEIQGLSKEEIKLKFNQFRELNYKRRIKRIIKED